MSARQTAGSDWIGLHISAHALRLQAGDKAGRSGFAPHVQFCPSAISSTVFVENLTSSQASKGIMSYSSTRWLATRDGVLLHRQRRSSSGWNSVIDLKAVEAAAPYSLGAWAAAHAEVVCHVITQ